MIYASFLYFLPVSHGFSLVQPALSFGRHQSATCTTSPLALMGARRRRSNDYDNDEEEYNFYYPADDSFLDPPPRWNEPIPRTVMVPRQRTADDAFAPGSARGGEQQSSTLDPRKNAPFAPRDTATNNDVYYYEEEDDSGFFDDTQFEPGPDNYWSNPVGRVDDARRPRRRSRNSRRSRLPERKTIVPPAVREFYDKLFWFGLGEDEEEDDEYGSRGRDSNYFGGTKGKFNGLSYFDDVKAPQRRRPRNDVPYYDDPDEEQFRGQSEKVDEYESRKQTRELDEPTSSPPRSSRNSRLYGKENGFDSRFVKNEEEYDGAEEWIEQAPPRRRRRRRDYYDDGDDDDDRSQASWNLWDAFLGRSDSESRRRREERAAEYDRAMGLSGGPPPKAMRRPGFTYRYEDEDEEDEYDRPARNVNADPIESPVIEVIDAEPIVNSTAADQSKPDSPLSWEERVLAVEQIPPAGIPAWGPTGDLGVDARTQALSDALEDVGEAQARVRALEQMVQQAREDVSILRVDMQLHRRRLKQQGGLSVDEFNEECWRMEEKVDDAARKARFQQGRLDNAQQALKDIETRHWALLQHFDPDLASKMVDEVKKSTSFVDASGDAGPQID